MRATAIISIIPVGLLIAACGGGDRQANRALSADLQRDLAAASATSVELASASHAYKPTRFVSAIEQPGGPAPAPRATVKRPAPRRVTTARAPESAVAPEPAPEPEIVAPEQVAVTPEPATATAPEPTVIAPRPTPMPASYPGSVDRGTRGSGGGIGEGIGGIIGVIIRGGNGGIDHCDPRTDGRSRRGGGIFYPGSGRIPINPIIGAVIGDRMPTPRGGIFHR